MLTQTLETDKYEDQIRENEKLHTYEKNFNTPRHNSKTKLIDKIGKKVSQLENYVVGLRSIIQQTEHTDKLREIAFAFFLFYKYICNNFE